MSGRDIQSGERKENGEDERITAEFAKKKHDSKINLKIIHPLGLLSMDEMIVFPIMPFHHILCEWIKKKKRVQRRSQKQLFSRS